MSPQSSHQNLVQSPQPIAAANATGTGIGIIASTPDNWSFQHFLDRVAHVLIQGAGLYDSNQTFVLTGTGHAPQAVVLDMYRLFGFRPEQVKSTPSRPLAKVVYSCRTPLVHPYFAYRLGEVFGVDFGRPLSSKKAVVFLSRKGRRTLNGGRGVMNEDAVLDAIRTLLAKRGQGENLVVYNGDNFPTFREVVQFFSTHVRALIGVSGGGFYNLRWCGSDVLLIEVQPRRSSYFMGFWEEARLLQHNHWTMVIDGDAKMNVVIPVERLVTLTAQQLGQRAADTVRPMYNWDISEAGMTFRRR
jgi:hypothetical protein